LGIRNFS